MSQPRNLNDFVTNNEPLGPFRHESFENDLESSTKILANVSPLESVFRDQPTVIIGRQGSGKTAAIAAYRSFAKYGRFYGSIENDIKEKSGFNIAVVDWGQFHEMVRNVAIRASNETPPDLHADFIYAETLEKYWEDIFWDLIFQTFYKASLDDDNIKCEVGSVIKLYNTEDVLGSESVSVRANVDSLFESAKREVLVCLKTFERKCLILIDTMENYPVRSPMFEKVISGFLKCVNSFSSKHSDIKVVFCIPEEIEHFFETGSSNQVKDFGSAARLEWKPSDLLRVVAERYRIYLSLHGHDEDRHFFSDLKKKDFSRRDDIQWLFNNIMERRVVNRKGDEEDSLAYMIRHTQLLPREFILIFNEAIRRSRDSIGPGSKRWITAKAIVDAVEAHEVTLGDFILSPYKRIYPRLMEALDVVMPQMTVICRGSDLDALSRQFKGRIEEELINPWRMLFSMGVLGYLDTDAQGEPADKDRYVYANFCYNSKFASPFHDDRLYCVHPLFSRRWGMNRSSQHSKQFVYPSNIEHVRLGRSG